MEECQNIEFKETWGDDYLKWICGFANAQGGKLYIGVDDSENIIGVKNARKLLEDIPHKIVITLGIVAEVNLLKENTLEYIEIIVPPSSLPIAYRGTYHYRSGSTKQELRGTVLQNFLLKKMGVSWDDVSQERATLDMISPIHYEGLQRIEPLEIPEDALREAIFNAIIHKDYTGVHIQMRVYNDRVELWNSGKLPEELTPEKLLKRYSSYPRNKNIAEVFYRAGFIESWGRGIRKIVDGVKNAGLAEPKIEDADGGVRITIFRKGFVAQGVAQELTDIQKQILELIQNNPQISRAEIAEQIGKSVKTIERRLAEMENIVKFIGSGYSGHWQIIPAGDMEKQQND